MKNTNIFYPTNAFPYDFKYRGVIYEVKKRKKIIKVLVCKLCEDEKHAYKYSTEYSKPVELQTALRHFRHVHDINLITAKSKKNRINNAIQYLTYFKEIESEEILWTCPICNREMLWYESIINREKIRHIKKHIERCIDRVKKEKQRENSKKNI